jgi:isochorismate hydrolase
MPCCVLTVLHLLREAKIDQLKVTFGVYEDVLGLQVSVCDAFSFVEEL